MATRKSGSLDTAVGARIRMLRVNRGISQAVLAERIGVTSQQLQRFERGASRVGVSRLARIASVLEVSVSAFFESAKAGSAGLKSPVQLLADRDALKVLEAYSRMPSPWVRSCIARLVESIADRNSKTKSTVSKSTASKSTASKLAASSFDTVDLGERRKFPSRG